VLEQTLTPLRQVREGDIRLANRGTHARLMLSLSDIEVRAPDGRMLFRVPRLNVFQQDRLVLLGRNGVGKSQFVQLLRRALTGADVPGLRASPSIVMGYVDQLMSHLPDAMTPHGFVSERFRPGDQLTIRLLAAAGFSVDMQRRSIGQLSLGQKARLGLLALRLTEPNFYLMDEPTNHVDIAGQERLEQEILAQEATCVIVSHDRAFVEAIGTRFLLIERGTVAEVDTPDGYYEGLG
jgi:ATPase subunit of ABC transporter with duplicated ATPase domains